MRRKKVFVGDTVRVLRGHYKDRVGIVRQMWANGHLVISFNDNTGMYGLSDPGSVEKPGNVVKVERDTPAQIIESALYGSFAMDEQDAKDYTSVIMATLESCGLVIVDKRDAPF